MCDLWTACTNPDTNYIFGILTSRAFDSCTYGGLVCFVTPLPSKSLLGHSYKIYCRNPQLQPSRLAPFLSNLG